MLSNRIKLNNRPAIPFLKKLNNDIWTEVEIKIVVILRNYTDRMASGYAQISRLNPKAS